MFLKTGELKKIMKAALKTGGLTVGNIDHHYLVCTLLWGVYVANDHASNKFKAAITELIGDLPDPGECFECRYDSDNKVQEQFCFNYPSPYSEWREARDFATKTPVALEVWPYEYRLYQKKSTLGFLAFDSILTDIIISPGELEPDENMPGRPSVSKDNILYFKNDFMIYWVRSEKMPEKVREVVLPHLKGLDFFQDNWTEIPEEDTEDAEDMEEHDIAEEQLTYERRT